jgi:hypothetical protein
MTPCICNAKHHFCYVDCDLCRIVCPRYLESMMQWTMVHYLVM